MLCYTLATLSSSNCNFQLSIREVLTTAMVNSKAIALENPKSCIRFWSRRRHKFAKASLQEPPRNLENHLLKRKSIRPMTATAIAITKRPVKIDAERSKFSLYQTNRSAIVSIPINTRYALAIE